jgi:hypothetical protein
MTAQRSLTSADFTETAIRAEPFGGRVFEPEPGWATRHPDRAMAFLYVCPHDCDAVDEVLGLAPGFSGIARR